MKIIFLKTTSNIERIVCCHKSIIIRYLFLPLQTFIKHNGILRSKEPHKRTDI